MQTGNYETTDCLNNVSVGGQVQTVYQQLLQMAVLKECL